MREKMIMEEHKLAVLPDDPQTISSFDEIKKDAAAKGIIDLKRDAASVSFLAINKEGRAVCADGWADGEGNALGSQALFAMFVGRGLGREYVQKFLERCGPKEMAVMASFITTFLDSLPEPEKKA
jgi:hypothetical protein